MAITFGVAVRFDRATAFAVFPRFVPAIQTHIRQDYQSSNNLIQANVIDTNFIEARVIESKTVQANKQINAVGDKNQSQFDMMRQRLPSQPQYQTYDMRGSQRTRSQHTGQLLNIFA